MSRLWKVPEKLINFFEIHLASLKVENKDGDGKMNSEGAVGGVGVLLTIDCHLMAISH